MWENEIRAFEAQDRRRPPTAGAVLFIGSSSIVLWPSLAADFPGVSVIQRGFGGSGIEHVVQYADRIALPYRPSQIVVYAGDNDLGEGRTPEAVLADFVEFSRIIHHELPDTRIAFLSIKPSPARWHLIAQVRHANELVRLTCVQDSRLAFIDIEQAMLGSDGMPRPELYAEDGLHMTAPGYAIWRNAIASFIRI